MDGMAGFFAGAPGGTELRRRGPGNYYHIYISFIYYTKKLITPIYYLRLPSSARLRMFSQCFCGKEKVQAGYTNTHKDRGRK